MDSNLILGLFLSIPLSILANLLSTPLQKWVDHSSQKAASKARQKENRHIAKLKLTRADVFELFSFGFIRLLLIGAIGAIFSLIASSQFLISYFAIYLSRYVNLGSNPEENLRNITNASGMLFQMLGLLIVVNISLNTIKEINAIRKVDL